MVADARVMLERIDGRRNNRVISGNEEYVDSYECWLLDRYVDICNEDIALRYTVDFELFNSYVALKSVYRMTGNAFEW